MKYIFFSIILFALCNNMQAQLELPPGRYSLNQMKNFGKNAERIGDIYTAIYFYEIYNSKKKKKDIDVQERLAYLYMHSKNYAMAKQYFKLVYDANTIKNVKALFYYSQMCMSLGEYNTAKEGFTDFRKKYKGFNDEKPFRKLARFQLQGCEVADSLYDNPLDISITHLNSTINKAHIETSPISIARDSFLYISSATDSLIYYEMGDTLNMPQHKRIYLAVNKQNEWQYSNFLDGPFNDYNVDLGNACFNKNMQKIYFTLCEKNNQNKIICHLYSSEKKDGIWQEPNIMPYPVNHPDYSTSQPSVGYDSRYGQEIIYFSSDRPEGKGGSDIWCCMYNQRKEEYREPKNLGSRINTPGDEITPFYDMQTRTLYYSSNGMPGIGGFDVFKSVGENRNWISPENLGTPINSNADDLYFSIGKSREDGFFTSNRASNKELVNPNCCDDIFYYKWNDYIHLSVKGKVYDIPDNYIVEMINRKFELGKEINDEIQYVSGIPVQLYLENEETNDVFLINTDTTNSKGEYFFNLDREKNYYVSIKNYGYFNKKLSFETYGFKHSDTLKMNEVGVNNIPKKALKLDIFYEFGEANLSENMKTHIDTTLLELMQEVPHIVVEISSHTDNIGDADFNLELSQKRADNVINYLIENGISEERLTGIGFGETIPIAPNQLPDGSDNPEGREKNRRTEIKILGSLDKYYFEDNSTTDEDEDEDEDED